jgi:4-hydroxy-tetrahydrodipicolinate synthase
MKPKGIITAMVTPLDKTDHINAEATKQLVNRLIEKKVDGLFILGTNGEFHRLTDLEKIRFAELVVSEVNGRVPVYVGTGGNSTAQVIALSKEMTAVGADALSVITPYLVKITENELLHHYLSIAETQIAPLMLYNIPKNTGITITKNAVERLADHQNVIGIKDSSGNIETIKQYLNAAEGQAFSVLSGSDSLILEALKLGATGAVAATSNVLTEIDVAIYRYWSQGKLKEAQEMQESIEAFRRILKLGTVPSVLKAAVRQQGIDVGAARLPVMEPNQQVMAEIEQMMANYLKKFGSL